MTPAFSATAMRVGELLAGETILATPAFQRPYAWTTREIGQLLDDLLFAVDELEQRPERAGVFFLGTIVLIAPRDTDRQGAGPSRLQIIDGQQRLVTLTILYAVLRELARAEGDIELAQALDARIVMAGVSGGRQSIYRLAIRAGDAELMASHVQQVDGCLNEADENELEGAQRELIANRNFLLEELRGLSAGVRRRLARFLDDSCQVVVIRTDDTDSAYRIFTVVNQPGKPLSRNDILKAELIGELPAGQRAEYVARWEAAEQANGAQFEQVFSHIRTALGNGRVPVITELRALTRANGGAKAFLDAQVLPMAEVHAAMVNRGVQRIALPPAAAATLAYLDRLSHSDWVPPALLWLHINARRPERAVPFLTAIDRHAHGQMLLGHGRDKRIVRYAQIIEAIRAGAEPYGDKSLMAFGLEDQRNILFNATTNLYVRSSIGCKLLLLRLNDALAGAASGIDPATVTIEHVLPQRVGRASAWRQWYSDAAREHYAGSLGNLILVQPATNKTARNYELDMKLQSYARDPLMARLPLNAGILGLKQFGPAQVQQRETRLIAALRELWALSAPFERKAPE